MTRASNVDDDGCDDALLLARLTCNGGNVVGNRTDTGSRPPEMERICCCPSCL